MKSKVMRELLASLKDRFASQGIDAPDIREIIEKMHGELEQSGKEERDVPGKKELLQVPSNSKNRVSLNVGDLLAGRGKDKFPEYDANLLLSAVWRKHAGKIYHMRWGDEDEIEVTLGDVMKLRLEQLRDGVRLQFLCLRP